MTGLNIDKFRDWLILQGAEILPATNEYETLRFKGREVGVVYKSGKTSNKYTLQAMSCFLRNITWDGKPVNVGRKPGYFKEKVKLPERDGSDCFYCSIPMGDDITLEHLIPLVAGGKNTLSNMVLCHEKCNQEAGTKTIVEKVALALQKRLTLKVQFVSSPQYNKLYQYAFDAYVKPMHRHPETGEQCECSWSDAKEMVDDIILKFINNKPS